MEVTDELVNHLAHLTKLSFEGKNKEEVKDDLIEMVNFIDKIHAVDTENVNPLIFMTEEINILREDIPKQTISHEEALRNAPQKDSDYFRIPKVLNKSMEI